MGGGNDELKFPYYMPLNGGGGNDELKFPYYMPLNWEGGWLWVCGRWSESNSKFGLGRD